MKPRLSNQKNHALTLVEVLVVIVVLAVLAAILLPMLAAAKRHSGPNCVSNLKQIGLAYTIWAGDHNDKYPVEISVMNGGTMELVASGNVSACFQVMSNELGTPKILVCPEDKQHAYATNFTSGFNDANISYFVGLDAGQIHPQALLSGDDNFEISAVPVQSGLLEFPTNVPISWTATRHKFVGNIGLADGSVQEVTTAGLQTALQQTGVAANRLAIP
jgi:prepilin-type N-terminal cleavage/methylation domain-containing protein